MLRTLCAAGGKVSWGSCVHDTDCTGRTSAVYAITDFFSRKFDFSYRIAPHFEPQRTNTGSPQPQHKMPHRGSPSRAVSYCSGKCPENVDSARQVLWLLRCVRGVWFVVNIVCKSVWIGPHSHTAHSTAASVLLLLLLRAAALLLKFVLEISRPRFLHSPGIAAIAPLALAERQITGGVACGKIVSVVCGLWYVRPFGVCGQRGSRVGLVCIQTGTVWSYEDRFPLSTEHAD